MSVFRKGTLKTLLGLMVLVVSLVVTTMAKAGDYEDFTDISAQASEHYRQALFYLRTENPGIAVIELNSMAEKWRVLMDRFYNAPPDVFAQDTEWQRTLSSVVETISVATSVANKGVSAKARELLLPIRQTLAEMRARNGVTGFADCVNEMNAAMDALYVFRNSPPDFNNKEQIDSLRKKAAIARYVYGKCRMTAPSNYQTNQIFVRLMDDSLEALDEVWGVIPEKDATRLINILRELRSADQMIFLQFGQ